MNCCRRRRRLLAKDDAGPKNNSNNEGLRQVRAAKALKGRHWLLLVAAEGRGLRLKWRWRSKVRAWPCERAQLTREDLSIWPPVCVRARVDSLAGASINKMMMKGLFTRLGRRKCVSTIAAAFIPTAAFQRRKTEQSERHFSRPNDKLMAHERLPLSFVCA